MTTINIKDAAGNIQSINVPNADGRAAASGSKSVALSTEDKAVLDSLALNYTPWNYTGELTDTSTVVLSAASADEKNYIVSLQCSNSESPIDLILKDGSTEIFRVTLPALSTSQFNFPMKLLTTTNTALNATLSGFGSVMLNVQGYTL